MLRPDIQFQSWTGPKADRFVNLVRSAMPARHTEVPGVAGVDDRQ
jgi:hypothetical protein